MEKHKRFKTIKRIFHVLSIKKRRYKRYLTIFYKKFNPTNQKAGGSSPFRRTKTPRSQDRGVFGPCRKETRTGRRAAARNKQPCGLFVSPRESPFRRTKISRFGVRFFFLSAVSSGGARFCTVFAPFSGFGAIAVHHCICSFFA